jgi:hypothetical protein
MNYPVYIIHPYSQARRWNTAVGVSGCSEILRLRQTENSITICWLDTDTQVNGKTIHVPLPMLAS